MEGRPAVNPLQRLQTDIASRLEADEYFADIGVTLMRPRAELGFVQIQERVDQLINGLVTKAGKKGAAVLVLMPLADAPASDAPGPELMHTITVRVQELPIVNMGTSGTQKPAEEIALRVLQVLQFFTPGNGRCLVVDPQALTPTEQFDPKVTIDCRFRQQGGINPLAKVASPILTSSSAAAPGTVTITCATSGAAIYYTTDGSYPGSTNTAAHLYSAPFAQATSATIRAAAQKTALQGSDVVELTLT
jgi:hypothetical protein